MRETSRRFLGTASCRALLGAAALLPFLASPGLGQALPKKVTGRLIQGASTRIADPKLAHGGVHLRYFLKPASGRWRVIAEVLQGAAVIRTLNDSVVHGSTSAIKLFWDGRNGTGVFVDPGDYTVRISAPDSGSGPLLYPVTIVRLGITEIEARPNGGTNEWQMVYFRKATTYAFYATPAIHEYLSIKDTGEVSDLDLNDGSPRPAVPVHAATHEPVMEGANYEDDEYNYPLCYLINTQPILELTFGAEGTSAATGTAVPAGYPVPGYEIRARGEDGDGAWTSTVTSIAPGSRAEFTGPALPNEAMRSDVDVTWRWQYRATGAAEWLAVPGSFATAHRFYTIVAAPQFASGASGTQYSGPWVEVAEYLNTWRIGLVKRALNQATTNEVMVLGIFGQQGALPTAIEGVCYDCPIMGGDGGATHYYSFGTTTMDLSALLNNHAKGKYVNCSDCAGTSSVMIAMVGVTNVKMVMLGYMNLKAIWGIGCPGYTLNLWGSSHAFSYHHIITRDNATHVSDACMCVDEDGSPTTLPGTPGYNCDRIWTGTSGYMYLAASNNVSKTVETLPKLK
ncbi:MAG: hypothetical protein HY812_06870 [Planctomycetes bacterium]|nr:hypothetical protein [Planctomycetota bacterium]